MRKPMDVDTSVTLVRGVEKLVRTYFQGVEERTELKVKRKQLKSSMKLAEKDNEDVYNNFKCLAKLQKHHLKNIKDIRMRGLSADVCEAYLKANGLGKE